MKVKIKLKFFLHKQKKYKQKIIRLTSLTYFYHFDLKLSDYICEHDVIFYR